MTPKNDASNGTGAKLSLRRETVRLLGIRTGIKTALYLPGGGVTPSGKTPAPCAAKGSLGTCPGSNISY